jgi:FKBP-type peptidyl-prolyl cis-trans isomerase SlyD
VPDALPLRAAAIVKFLHCRAGSLPGKREEDAAMSSIRNLLLGVIATGCVAFGEGAFAQGDLVIADGMKVSLEYTLTLPDKSVADSNVGQEPITFVQGAHEIVPGLEKALGGMKAGQKRRIDVAAQDAYGPYNNKLRQSIEKEKLPKDVKVGDILQASDNRLVKVLEVNDQKVLIDLNHPLAGKMLTFDVNILKVEKGDATAAPDKKTP